MLTSSFPTLLDSAPFSTPDINWLYPVIIERRSFLLNLCCKQFVKNILQWLRGSLLYVLSNNFNFNFNYNCFMPTEGVLFGSGLVSTTPRPSAMVRYLSRRHSPTLDTMFQHRDRERHRR